MAIPPFWGWTGFTPALPEFYEDVYSREQVVKTQSMLLKKMGDYLDLIGDTENENREVYNEMMEEFRQFKETSGFDFYTETYQSVLQRLDTAEDVLPIEDFSAENTVKDNIDNLQEQIDVFRELTSAEISDIVAPYSSVRAI